MKFIFDYTYTNVALSWFVYLCTFAFYLRKACTYHKIPKQDRQNNTPQKQSLIYARVLFYVPFLLCWSLLWDLAAIAVMAFLFAKSLEAYSEEADENDAYVLKTDALFLWITGVLAIARIVLIFCGFRMM